ncbi:hypothetical protein BC832DRAFT_203424 [Gaertneriomyces semiglobifer]|nr:hypothetical protein BC832DRAFT_203424 [Gaertneriomyces semiglobifer]
MPTVDDPHCVFHLDGSFARYDGYLDAWASGPDAPCIGLNIRGLNVAFPTLGLALSIGGLACTWYFLLRERKTTYNYTLMAVFGCFGLGSLADVIAAADDFQFGGHPNVSHLPKILYYIACMVLFWAEGVRLNFIFIVLQRPRHYTQKIVYSALIFASILLIIGVAVFAIGVVKGRDSAPVPYTMFYLVWLLSVGIADAAISITILRLSHRQSAILHKYDKLTTEQVAAFARRFRIISIFHIIFILGMGILFGIASGGTVGYSYSYFTTPTLPLQAVSLLCSMLVLQKMETMSHRKTATSSGVKSNGSTQTGSKQSRGQR